MEEISVLEENIIYGSVESVNGKSGIVNLTTSDIPNDSGYVTQQDINDSVAQEAQARQQAVNAEAQARQDSDLTITNSISELSSQVGTNTQDIAEIKTDVNTIDSAINKTVLSNVTISADTSTDTLSLDSGKVNIKTGATSSAAIPFPVASASEAGVMNSATFIGLQQTTDIANGLLNGAVAVSGLAAEPTQAQLTTAWETATGRTELMNRAVLYDITNEKLWTYYTNTSTWYSAAAGGGSVDVQPWTNTQAGIVKGSTTDGQIFAENDGTGSVNGWDTIKTNIQNLEQAGYQTETDVNNKIAATKVSDLSDGADYVKNTDYATHLVGGVIKIDSTYDTNLANGVLTSMERTYAQYQSKEPRAFISKGTLENVIAGKGLVSNTDYATTNVAGVIKPSSDAGTYIDNSTGRIYARTYTYPQYTSGLSGAGFIGKDTLENVITGKNIISTITLTQAEYDALTTYADNTNYQIIE